jgi:hypothetical protein
LASVAYIVQICLVYWYASAWKWAPEWRSEGTAIYLAMKVDYFATRFTHFMLNYPELLRYLTFATIYLEAFGPAVLLLPFAPGLQRMLVISAFILFHIGLAVNLELGTFPQLCCVAWLALLPTPFWNRLQAQMRQPEVAGLTLYYDADRRKVALRLGYLRTFLLLGDARLMPAQEVPERLPAIRKEGGWAVLDAQGTEHHGVQALVFLVRLSPVFSPFAALPPAVPAWMPPGGLLANTILLFCLVYVILWNVRTYGIGSESWYSTETEIAEDQWRWVFPNQAAQFGSVLGLEQGWGLFAPRPGKVVGWHLLVGTQKDGKKVDLLRDGAPVDRSKPELLAATYPNGRWRKLLMNLAATKAYPNLAPGVAVYYFREWNARHEGEEQLRAVEVIYMQEETRPPGVEPSPVQEILQLRYEPDAPPSPATTAKKEPTKSK